MHCCLLLLLLLLLLMMCCCCLLQVWYGVPAHASEQFEDAMRAALPQLFAKDPQLLYGQATHMSPCELRRRGVPVCR